MCSIHTPGANNKLKAKEMNEKETILAALRDALEYWVTHAKSAHQRGIIEGLQIAIQKVNAIN